MSLSNFEDLNFLFDNSKKRKIIRLDWDEATYLYKVIKNLNKPLCVEIGRMYGGSTLLMISACNGKVVSIDNHTAGAEILTVTDCYLKKLLEYIKPDCEVEIIVGDSGTALGPSDIDVLFIDGDHRYEGVKKDFLHWEPLVKKDGSILFHDTDLDGVRSLLGEVEGKLNKVNQVGTLIHFAKV